MCGSAPGSGFSEILPAAVGPLWWCAWIGSLNHFVLGPPQGPHQPATRMVWRYLSSHDPHFCLHTCHQTHFDGVTENTMLTSSADRQDVTSSAVLSAHCWAGASWQHNRTLLWKSWCYQTHNFADTAFKSRKPCFTHLWKKAHRNWTVNINSAQDSRSNKHS